MIKFHLVILIILTFSVLLYPQKTKIIKIHDTNLFVGKNGKLFKLSNVETPSLYDSDSLLQYIAQMAIEYAEMNLLNRVCHYERSLTQVDSNILSVHLFRKYPLQKQNINKEYIQNGYGKYVQNQDSVYHSAYQKAEEKAKNRNIGIWNPLRYVKVKYTLGVFYGYGIGNKNYNDSQFREHWLSIESQSIKNRTSLLIGRMDIAEEGSGCCECPDYYSYVDYRIHYRLYSLRLKYFHRWKYFAYEIGLWGAYQTRGWCDEMVSLFLLPVIQLQLGPISKYYLYFSYPDEFAFVHDHHPYIAGLAYKLDKKFSEISLGAGKLDNSWALTAKIDYLVFKDIFIKLHILSHPANQSYSLRFNLGYLF